MGTARRWLAHLGVGLGHLLVERLVVVDGQLQVLHPRRQASLAADLAPGIHARQELEEGQQTHSQSEPDVTAALRLAGGPQQQRRRWISA